MLPALVRETMNKVVRTSCIINNNCNVLCHCLVVWEGLSISSLSTDKTCRIMMKTARSDAFCNAAGASKKVTLSSTHVQAIIFHVLCVHCAKFLFDIVGQWARARATFVQD